MNIPENMKQISDIAQSLTNNYYWSPCCIGASFVAYKQRWTNSLIDHELLIRGWAFNNREDCLNFCDKLNNAIRNIK